MIDIAVGIIADALRGALDEACASMPNGPAVPMQVLETDDLVSERSAPTLCRVDAQDSVTLTYPMETDDPVTLTVGFTVTLRRADVPSLTTATTQQMRRAVLKCERAIARALVQAFDVQRFGLIESEGVSVYTPREITIAEPDTEVDDSTTQGTVTAVFVTEDRFVLARSA